ncbi:MAG: stage III sporulation protein AE [Bacteroides sp.]|nr:stage III sporulation protein AE [Bacteroides sp.]MCM1548578.1 stage III sporulation protein AE [Clostridium sp.]
MKCLKISGMIQIAVLVFFLYRVPVQAGTLLVPDTTATEAPASTEEQSVQDIQEDMLQEYDFTALDQVLQENFFQEHLTFGDLVSSLMQGDVTEQDGLWKEFLYQTFLEELDANRGILVKLILLAMITAIFTNLSGSIGKGMISENGFYITYLIMTALLLSSFTLIYQVGAEAVEEILGIMEALIPTYMMAVGVSSGVTSSVVLQEGMVMGITAVSWGIQTIVFPLIQLFVMLGLVNNLMEGDYFSKLGELLQTGTSWLMKSVLAFVVGLNAVKSMLAPAADSVTTTALQRGLTVIPGGQAVNAVSGVVIGSGILIKNAIGVGGMLLLAAAVCVPVLKMSVFILSYKFLAALLQPIADPRMIRGLQSISEGGQMLITAVLTVIILFLLSIAIVTVSTNVTYYAG